MFALGLGVGSFTTGVMIMDAVQVQKWKTEPVLLALVFIVSIAIWGMLAVSVIGIIYAAMIAVFFFLSHLGFIAYVRGSAVRVSPEQFPDLHERIVLLASRVGLSGTPEAYIMQAGGALNALATKLFRSDFIVMYSDLLDACEGNDSARDMIIGHELGHIRAGHLRLLWFILPGLMVPFLGTAYSRAREYTCDRYGMAVAKDKLGALQGLAILSAGAKHGQQINLHEFVKQREALDSAMMTLGKWMGTHPALCERILALDGTLNPEAKPHRRGPILATIVIAAGFIVPLSIGIGSWFFFSSYNDKFSNSALPDEPKNTDRSLSYIEVEELAQKVRHDLDTLAVIINQSYAASGEWPSGDYGVITELWEKWRPERVMPLDPFDYHEYAYYRNDSSFAVYSCGPDGKTGTKDDMVKWVYDSKP